MRSVRRWRLTVTNSPERTLRTYRFCVYGSNDSLLPSICAVLAVGIGATSKEFRIPCLAIRDLRSDQSHRPELGFTPHMSNCNCPLLAGDPSYVSYGPSVTA